MDESEIERFRALLLRQRDEIQGSGDLRLDPNRADPVAKKDDDAQPLNEMHQAITSSRNRARTASLHQIEAALARLEAEPEDFGLCEVCEEPIATRRLELMPHARLCVKCQSEREGPAGARRRNLTDYV